MSDQPRTPGVPPPPPVNDPMFRSLDKTGPLEKAVRNAKKEGGSSWLIPGILFACVFLLLGYCIFLTVMNSKADDKILQLTKDLDSSDNRIDQLEEQIYKTQNELAKQIDATSRELSSVQAQQSQQVARIQDEMTRKAGKDEVASVNRKTETIGSTVGTLKDNIQTVDQSVKQVDTKVGDLGVKVDEQAKTIEEQRKLIEQNIHNINATRETLDQTRDSLMNLKTSLDRDYFVFQLTKKAGIIRVKDVGLRLKKTKVKDQNFDIEIFYDDQKMGKKKIAANEPVYFFKMGFKKPYEMVATKVQDDQIQGYISVPKVAD
jgi:hypothetical protein